VAPWAWACSMPCISDLPVEGLADTLWAFTSPHLTGSSYHAVLGLARSVDDPDVAFWPVRSWAEREGCGPAGWRKPGEGKPAPAADPWRPEDPKQHAHDVAPVVRRSALVDLGHRQNRPGAFTDIGDVCAPLADNPLGSENKRLGRRAL